MQRQRYAEGFSELGADSAKERIEPQNRPPQQSSVSVILMAIINVCNFPKRQAVTFCQLQHDLLCKPAGMFLVSACFPTNQYFRETHRIYWIRRSNQKKAIIQQVIANPIEKLSEIIEMLDQIAGDDQFELLPELHGFDVLADYVKTPCSQIFYCILQVVDPEDFIGNLSDPPMQPVFFMCLGNFVPNATQIKN